MRKNKLIGDAFTWVMWMIVGSTGGFRKTRILQMSIIFTIHTETTHIGKKAAEPATNSESLMINVWSSSISIPSVMIKIKTYQCADPCCYPTSRQYTSGRPVQMDGEPLRKNVFKRAHVYVSGLRDMRFICHTCQGNWNVPAQFSVPFYNFVENDTDVNAKVLRQYQKWHC